MRIVEVNIAHDSMPVDGLQDIKMQKLGQFVVLVGKNGSGKSRILKRIENAIQKHTHEQLVRDREIEKMNALIQQQKDDWQRSTSIQKGHEYHERKLSEYTAKVRPLEKKFNELKTLNYRDFPLIFDSRYESYNFLYFLPKELAMSSPDVLTVTHIRNSLNSFANLYVRYNEVALPIIQQISNNYLEAHILEGDLKAKYIKDFEKLKSDISKILGLELGRNMLGQATLNDFPLAGCPLSDGQKILLQFIVALFFQQKSLDDVIVILDEPENHLHPDVMIEIISIIRESTTKGQVWIATHCVPLISQFNSSEIFYVDEGNVTFGGKIPEKVLRSLIGGQERIDKLKDFLSLPAILSSNRYAYECLFSPSVVMTDGEDPQIKQIRSIVEEKMKEKKSKNEKLRILDYGAGKGRLIANLIDIDDESLKKDITDNVEYIAFDIEDKDKMECLVSIESVFERNDNCYFNSVRELREQYGDNAFDIVIMCNVLHEIESKYWLDIFGTEKELDTLMATEGHLLVVEDNHLPVGEKAYTNGFCVLNTIPLSKLFNFQPGKQGIISAERNGRLKAHLIPRNFIITINNTSRENALKEVKKEAEESISSIRSKNDSSYQSGQLLAFYMQQFANASLELKQYSL